MTYEVKIYHNGKDFVSAEDELFPQTILRDGKVQLLAEFVVAGISSSIILFQIITR